MWQDLQFDSCAHWFVFQLLLHIAALVHIQNSIIYLILKKKNSQVKFEN